MLLLIIVYQKGFRPMHERNTRQREAIGRAIAQAGRPLSPREIHDLARIDIGFTTLCA